MTGLIKGHLACGAAIVILFGAEALIEMVYGIRLGTLVLREMTKPTNWFDLVAGFFFGGGIVALLGAILSLWEARRFLNEFYRDGPGGGAGRSIRLPLSRKVVSLEEFRRQRQRGPGPSTSAVAS